MMTRGMEDRGAPRVFGLTGGMGSGKSMVAAFLARVAGWLVLDVDQVCRDILEPDRPGWRALARTFDHDFFRPDRHLDRKLLRQAIFRDSELRHRIDRLLHPLAREEVAVRITAWKRTAVGRESGQILVVEAPLLYEAGWDKDFREVIVVYADDATCRARVAGRDRVTAGEAEAAVAAQLPLAVKARLADHVIDNSGCISDTYLQLLHLLNVVAASEIQEKTLDRA
ncbi:MAG: dephospho-CoA kinase [Desulfobacterales bacterium]|nr:dephospho-CoA kinase [Desulfobacterales bacterium]